MKIYLLTQDENSGYDTYDAIVVCAENKDDAKTIGPNGKVFEEGEKNIWNDSWATKLSNINCDEIGIANPDQIRGIIITSFNAG